MRTLSSLVNLSHAGLIAAFSVVAVALWSVQPLCAQAADPRIEKLVRQLGSENFDERERAVKELIEIGAPALESLRKLINSQDPEVAKRAKECIPDIERNEKVLTLVAKLSDKSVAVRANALASIGEYGAGAHKAVPALILALDDEDAEVRRCAICVLGMIGPAAERAIPTLIRMLQNQKQSEEIRWTVAVDLGKLGPKARIAIPIFLHMLDSEGVLLQNGAVNALGEIGQDHEGVVPALIKALDHQDHRVCDRAALALIKLQQQPNVSIPALIAFMKNHKAIPEYDYPRSFIASELWRFSGSSKTIVTVLINIATDKTESERVRRGAVEGLGFIGPGAKDAIAPLKEIRMKELRNCDPRFSSKFDDAIVQALMLIEKH